MDKTKYIPSEIEAKWQNKWTKTNLYKFNANQDKIKYYNLVEFPYPSGDLHLGHWFAFVGPDVRARYKRMKGFNVLFTNGFDAFGLPAENAAIKRGIHPKDWTLKNIETMTKQFNTMGTMIDWTHKVITCLPEYYKWNQWIFIKMFEKKLIYRKKSLSNWCSSCQTVLANENIEAGKCWRCKTDVIQKEIEQWFIKITDYADKLLWPANPKVKWPKSVIEGQNNWIGKSEGLIIKFKIIDAKGMSLKKEIKTYTVFPETIFGVTYIVLAPEHPMLDILTSKDMSYDVQRYKKQVGKKTELQRKENKEKSGVFIGAYAINPATLQKIPIWTSDYVISGYATAAVMGVPGSDLRDFEFAKKYKLPIVQVVSKDLRENIKKIESSGDVLEEGYLINSGNFNGLKTPTPARKHITEWLIKNGKAEKQTNYHLHDWSISRQRYWGTPIPVIHCLACGIVPVDQADLPVELPYEVDYTPKGKPPLATAKDWFETICPKCNGKATRDPETLDTFFDSSWYFFRYLNPDYAKGPFDPDLVKKLMPVDIYFGGSEHTLGHTMYARFFTKFFKDINLIEFDEFASRRFQHGVILGPDGNRMSKSKGNVVNPDDVVKEYGSDSVRVYLCFMMPYDQTAPWSITAISGIYRFLKRFWELQYRLDNKTPNQLDLKWINKTIQKVSNEIENVRLNTAISTLMEWLNYLSSKKTISKDEYCVFILLLSPFAPHITEEIWQKDKHNDKFISVHLQKWPGFNIELTQDLEKNLIIQIDGKTRDIITISSSIVNDQKSVEEKAKASKKISKYLPAGKKFITIYIKGKVVNFVTMRS